MEATLERPTAPSRRAWSRRNDTSNMASLPSVPPLPSQLSPALSAPESSKRRSAPSSNSSRSRRHHRKSANAPPEVISTLIDSLSNVDFASNDILFPSTPIRGQRNSKTAPTTPTLRPKRSFGQESAGSNNFSGFSGHHHAGVISENVPDDAAEPPVIRTSKRPSGYSDLTSSKKVHQSGLASYLRNGYARSTSSLTSNRDDDTKSLDTGRRRSITSASRESLHSRLGSRDGHKNSLPQEQARGQVKDANIGRETLLVGTGISNGVSEHLYSPRGPASPMRLHPFNAPIEEEPPLPNTTPVLREPQSSKREGKRPVVELDSSPATGPLVPSRKSSLRRQDIPTPPKNRRNSLQSSPRIPNQSATVAEVEEPQLTSGLPGLEGDDTEVTKRIKELKAKKELREKEARQSVSPEFRSSLPPSKEPGKLLHGTASPTAITPDTWELLHNDNSSSEKTRRGANPGNIHVPPSEPFSQSPVKATQNGTTSGYLASPERPPTPLTPTALPINYSYVVQSLNRHSPPSSIAASSSRASTRTARRKSIAVGGRSAAARAKAAKIVENRESTHSSPEPPNSDSGSNSLDDRQSLGALEPSVSKTKRSNSVKAKQRRWSHPDLPLGIQRSGSMHIGDSLAVRPPDTVQEERPSSRDSIDQDVITFIHAPRLSQKIRHPASGRTIAFSEVGDPQGHAVFCCVGMGLTRYVTAFYDELATTLRLRLITPDRPGVGESQADSHGTPLNWPDDVSAICGALDIKKFSIMAHSAGAIYALATALRMPQHIRGRVHLLAPWIPPSQMAPIGITNQDPPPGAQLPKSQRFLRVLPAPFLKVANTSFMSAASASLSPQGTNSPSGKKKRKSFMSKESKESKEKEGRNDSPMRREASTLQPPGTSHIRRESIMLMDQQNMPDGSAITAARSQRDLRGEYGHSRERSFQEDSARREVYDARLTLAIWDKATTNANPAVDLLICLERHQPIGFMYKDITRAVVIHHGSKDTRVPVENVRWLGSAMRRCEVRVLDGQGHGLMAIPSIMGGVLEEIGREWRDWEEAVRRGADKPDESTGTPTTATPSKWDSMRGKKESPVIA